MEDDDIKHVVLLECDVVNKNGRVYPTGTIEKFLEQRSDKPMFGFIDGMDLAGNLDLRRVSHIVEDLYIQDGKFMAKMKVVSTPMGNIVKDLERGKVEVEFAVAGHGCVDLNGNVSDFQMTHVGVISPGSKA